MMRLLWMKSDYVLPAETGGRIRSYNLMRELHALCDVTYVCRRTPGQETLGTQAKDFASRLVSLPTEEEQKSGAAFYARVLAGMASPVPYFVQKNRDERFRVEQRRFVERGLREAPDGPLSILCDFLDMGENVAWELPCAKVLFEHNVETDIWDGYYTNETHALRRLYFDFERRRARRYEASVCNRFDHVFAVTEEDRKTLRDGLGVERPIDLLETGVDTDFFRPDREVRAVPERLLFLGSLDWMPNIDACRWFVEEIYPAIRAQRPGVTLDVIGRRPVAEIRRFAERDSSIRLVADVPDVRPFVAQCELVVVPLRIGGGSRIRIYEAMAMGRPVVSTTLGAQGLRLRSGREIELVDAAPDFASRCVALIADRGQREAMAARGEAFVRSDCSWRQVAQRLHDRCVEAAMRRRGAA